MKTVKNDRQQKQRKDSAKEPRLGIFWLVRDTLIFDSIPLSESEPEPYSTHRTHPRSHVDVWEGWRVVGKVPPESEYEEFPRGRLIYDTTNQSFTILADRCILGRKELIGRIKEELHLPKKTAVGTDPHYRCFDCLYGSDDNEG